MPFDLFIFDFDGTLVDSTAIKQSAFYELFPGVSGAGDTVAAVLAEDPEGSRERVIREMLRRLGRSGETLEQELREVVARYTEVTDDAVGRALELPGASGMLQALRRAHKRVYVSSNTPEGPLRALLAKRGWLTLLDGAFGFPAQKAATARRLIDENKVDPARTAVVGDGESDRVSAAAVGARFFPVRAADDLQRLGASWGLGHV